MSAASVVNESRTMEFQAEVKQLLNIVINSLYTHREIFLRELIANASDALDKLRLLALTDASVLEDAPELGIRIELDAEARTLTIADNGIGMTYDEVVENIGTIARSGSARFIEHLRAGAAGESSLNLIGQFGVGFYSAFMVADRVTLVTRAPGQSRGVRWESTGDGTYRIEPVEKRERGTRITLHLKEYDRANADFAEDFLNQYTIQKHIQTHCNFIAYPIRMDFVTEEQTEAGDQPDGASEPRTVVTEKILNSIQPIWAKAPKEISRADYLSFYQQQFHDWDEPADIIHARVEGVEEFTALLFIPAHAPYGLYTGEPPKGPQLYCKHVLVMDDCRELLPDYLRFVRGVVDSPDLTLNISRETLQHNGQLRVVRNYLEKKVLEALRAIQTANRQKYETLWGEFGKALKGGIFTDYKNTEKLQDLLLFASSHAPEGLTTLREYVARMPAEQTSIFYAVGESRAAIERLPQMEAVREKGLEVLYFLDKVDEFLTQHLREYDGKPLQSVSRGELDLTTDTEAKQEPAQSTDESFQPLLDFVRATLSDKVREVRLSKRLKSSPVCLVSGASGFSLNMERLMREANQDMFRATRILELNPEHSVIRAMRRLHADGNQETRLANYCRVLYDQALLIESEKVEDPVSFANIVAQLMVEACGQENAV
jgi:molecular chaperone HtpG